MTWRFQFTLRTVLLALTLVAVSLAGIVQVPHVFVFASFCLMAASLTWVVYRWVKRKSWWILFAGLAVVAWVGVYVLSLGPFIAFCEFDRKITGRFHLGRLAPAYLPIVLRLNNYQSFRWYTDRWIPIDSVGVRESYPAKISEDLVGTWQTEGTQVVNLRGDGTGRAYGSLTSSDLIYCEWAANAGKFAIYQYGSKRSPPAWFGYAIMHYSPTDTYDVVESSATHFKLREKTGRIISLTRSHDNKLESAP